MLDDMQQSADSVVSTDSPSFAGLLAALTSARSRVAGEAGVGPPSAVQRPMWREDELEDDVATLSYERALQKNARYRPVNPDVWDEPKRIEFNALQGPLSDEAVEPERELQPEPAAVPRTGVAAVEVSRKRASVTVRLSAAEYEQLHKRAAEAGLTVSAYLRSCTFEAEALRAQVKDALAQLRAGQPPAKTVAVEAGRGWWMERIARMIPRGQIGQRVARA